MKFKVQAHEAKTLSWWHTRKSSIDFDPPYQRKGKLWSDFDKAYLIDSMINGFDVPKLYLADFTYNDSPKLNPRKKMYAIIDGKQRLEAIFDFVENKIPLNNNFKYFKNSSCDAANMTYRDLKSKYPELAETLDNFNLSVVSVISDSEEPINDLFVRLNRSKALTGAEIRNAMNGKTPKVINELSKGRFFTECISFPSKRGQSLNAIAKILMIEFYEKIQDTKKSTLDKFVDIGNNQIDKLELAARRTRDILEEMAGVFLPSDDLLKSSGNLPIIYLFYRDVGHQNPRWVRAFLGNFEDTKKLAKTSSSKEFSTYREYNELNRSINDEATIRRKSEILKSEWRKFTEKKKH